MGVDGFFATICASAWLSSASAVSRSGDVNLSAASRLAVSFFAFCWAVIGMSPDTPYLKSTSFCSRGQAENPHILGVLALGDEFRERIAFCGTHEKIGKCLAQRVCHDKLRWRDTGTNGSQPGPERVPDELGSNDGEILEQSLGDDAGLDEGMISADFAFDTAAVVGRFAMKILIAVAVTQRDHVLHPEMVGE